MEEEIVALAFVVGVFGIGALKVVTHFLLEWRKMGVGGSKEVVQLRDEMDALRRDTQRIKADQNDTLLGLAQDVRRIEARLDRQAGIDVAPPDPRPREAAQRQL